ncbi:hypothetical protein [Brucella intermedia]|uniref:hypothetical protein n=1 Tax=Brucella intermedia TaxID=94625 RepID=UPI0023603AD5|nr:hypothetical protein [Brucella intermedia]
MAGKTDKTKLASAILNVGATRITGVEKGATVNGGSEKAENAPQKPQGAAGASRAGVGEVEAARGAPAPADVPSSADPADAKTDRIAFLCSPRVKKHLKRLAIDRDTDVSSLIREALEAKGYLP